jgi:hypothetical protein
MAKITSFCLLSLVSVRIFPAIDRIFYFNFTHSFALMLIFMSAYSL